MFLLKKLKLNQLKTQFQELELPAEDKLDEAKAETKGAEKNVTLADTALTDAKKADEKRQKLLITPSRC